LYISRDQNLPNQIVLICIFVVKAQSANELSVIEMNSSSIQHHENGKRRPKGSTQRRLRKMSQEFLPTQFSFSVQTHMLCVGHAVVYRVAIAIAKATCVIRHSTQQSDSPLYSWVIAMSEAKFNRFYKQACSILNQMPIKQYLARTDLEWKPFENFLYLLVAALSPQEQLQGMFCSHPDVGSMNVGKFALESFLIQLWGALETMLPTLAFESHISASLGKDIVRLYVLIRDFLAFPESILEENSTYANAILCLEDVVEPPKRNDLSCSICLEVLLIEQTQEYPIQMAAPFSVKLPCTHQFHENCIMAWLRHNPSCPECRSAVGSASNSCDGY
jgi:hypothetical protein